MTLQDCLYVGVYWANRSLDLREYADRTRAFLTALESIHPVFGSLEWPGNRWSPAAALGDGFRNLDDIIYQHVGGGDCLYHAANNDGSPSWASTCDFGFSMRYLTNSTAVGARVGISLTAGNILERLWNAAVITFPEKGHPDFPFHECYDYEFAKNLLATSIRLWKPDDGRVSSHELARRVSAVSIRKVGWLTYIADRRATALQDDRTLKDVQIEALPEGGAMFSLDRQIVSPPDEKHLDKARRLGTRLALCGLIDA